MLVTSKTLSIVLYHKIKILGSMKDSPCTPWKINGWNLQITHEKKGKLCSLNLHDYVQNVHLQGMQIRSPSSMANHVVMFSRSPMGLAVATRSSEAPISCECSRAASQLHAAWLTKKRSTKVAKVTCLSDFMVVFWCVFFPDIFQFFEWEFPTVLKFHQTNKHINFKRILLGYRTFRLDFSKNFHGKNHSGTWCAFQSRWDFASPVP